MILHNLIYGAFLGWGAAIPIGPINLEIVRRNLNLGTRYGVAIGCGACTADIAYLVLLSCGMLSFLAGGMVMKVITILGACVLFWFGYSALRMSASDDNHKTRIGYGTQHFGKHYLSGLLMTLLSPFTIIFWLSVSSQIASLTVRYDVSSIFFAGLGVFFGSVSWFLSLNLVLHITRNRLPTKTTQVLNIVGGVILIGFAIMGLFYGFTRH